MAIDSPITIGLLKLRYKEMTIGKSTARELETLFHGTLACLAGFGLFRSEVMVAVDGTQIATGAEYAVCGCLKVTKNERNEQGIEVKVVELVYGWRLLAFGAPQVRSPSSIW